MRYKRSSKTIKQDTKRHFAGLAARTPERQAKWWFGRRPYEVSRLSDGARSLIRAQGMQIGGGSDDGS